MDMNKTEERALNGVFWKIEDSLLSFVFEGPDIILPAVAKSGNTYNHMKLWNELGFKKPYNYYPRGRVDVNRRGQATIFMNPNIEGSFISEIKKEFRIRGKCRVIYDCSFHYRCHLDDGCVAG